MKYLLIIYLLSIPLNCFALSTPSDIVHDTIKQEKDSFVNDVRYEVHKSTHEIMQKFKDTLATILTWAAETGTVVAIGWCFTFLVDKATAKMIKLITLMCLITEIIKELNKFINYLNS